MDIKKTKASLLANVIIDGKIMYKNLENINKDEKWLNKELKVHGKDLDNILLCTVDINNKVLFYERNYDEKTQNVLE